MTTRKNKKKNPSKTKIKQQTDEITNTIQKWGLKLPKQRPPVIVISGTAGNGKTTTINCLFGKRVGKVGHFKRGTEKAKIYEWVSKSANIHIIDLPGLGESDRNDKKIGRLYSKYAKKADGVIVIVRPRLYDIGTEKTVRLLLKSGFPSEKIIFGFNKVYMLNYDKGRGKNKKTYSVNLNGLDGVTKPFDLRAVETAKRELLRSLKKEFPKKSFDLKRIVEFDALSGWNLYKMFDAVINLLPFNTLKGIHKVRRSAHKDIVEKERKSLVTIERRQKKVREELRKSKKQQELKNIQQNKFWEKIVENTQLKETTIREAEKKLEKERQEIKVSKLQAKQEIQQLEEKIKAIEEKAEKSLSVKPSQKNSLPIEDTNKLIQDEARAIRKIENIKEEQQIKETKLNEDEKKFRQLREDLEEIKEEQKRRIREDELNKNKLKSENMEQERRLKALEDEAKNAEKGLRKIEEEKLAHEESFGEKVVNGIFEIAEKAGVIIVVSFFKRGIKAVFDWFVGN
ncbi:MAG: 50S ribosome-binding GTPase [Chloroflexi bacterium]|nr:50S ribosome-binding GTPase [Chloroflexota bacterium]